MPTAFDIGRLAAACLLTGGALLARADEDSEEIYLNDVRNGIVDRTHASISDGVEAFISRVDALFASNESYDAPSGSYLRVGGAFSLRETRHGGSEFDTILKAKIRLPRTNSRLQIIVDRGIENVMRSDSQVEAEHALGRPVQDDSLFVGLRAAAVEKLDISLTSDAGVRLRNVRLDPFLRGRALRAHQVGEWRIPLSETLLWRNSEGSSAATELSFVRALESAKVLSFTSNATYRFDHGYFDLSQVASLTKRLDRDSLLAAELGVFGHSEPATEVTTYTAALRYRQRLWREWLLMEVRPQLTLPRERHFATVPSITFSLEAYFGRGKLPEP